MADDPTEDTSSELEAPAHEPTLPGLELPDYHGRKPSGMKTALGGAGNRLSSPHEIGDRVVLLIEAKVKKAGHEETDDGLLYVENLKVSDLFEIPGQQGRRLLSVVRERHRTAAGDVPLAPDLGAEVTTAADGTVLTPDELAEVRGDPVKALDDDRLDPVVAEFSDGSRSLWPDEFDKGEKRPSAGDRFEDDDAPGGFVYVRKLLHASTGETLEEVDPEAIEKAVADEERTEDELAAARADREAAEELEAGRRHETAEDPADPTPEEQIDPPEADAPAEVSFAGDAPDDELEADGPFEEEGTDAEVVHLPTKEDFDFVDRKISELSPEIAEISDRDRLARLLKAEEQGRGRGLKPRDGALEVIRRRMAELFSAPEEIPEPDLPDDAELDVPDDELEA